MISLINSSQGLLHPNSTPFLLLFLEYTQTSKYSNKIKSNKLEWDKETEEQKPKEKHRKHRNRNKQSYTQKYHKNTNLESIIYLQKICKFKNNYPTTYSETKNLQKCH